MKYWFVLLLLSVIFGVAAQQDTLVIDSTAMNNSLEYKLPHYFSKDSIANLPLKNEIIASKEPKEFRQYFFLFMLNILMLSVLLYNYSRGKINRLMSALSNYNMLKQYAIVEQKRSLNHLYAFFLLYLIYIIIFAVVLTEFLEIRIDNLNFGLAIASFFLLDFITNRVTAYVLGKSNVMSFVYFNNVGFLVFTIPFLILGIALITSLQQSSTVYLAGGITFVLFAIYLVKELRNIRILNYNKIKVGSFNFFLYLCTFKILPFAVFIKYVKDNLIN